MKKTKPIFIALLAVLIIIGVINTATAVTWGVCNGDDLEYKATKYIDNQSIIDTTYTMTVTFNVTYVGDYVTADMSEDGGAAVSVFLNTQSLDDDYGINIRTSFGMSVRYIADEQRIQTLMTQIQNEIGAVLANFSMSRTGNNLLISAHGIGSGTSWTYGAEINYTSNYVLNSMSEIHFLTDGINIAVENVLWTKVHHHSTCVTPAPELPMPIIIGISAAVVVGVIVVVIIILKRR
ncbi:MAG: hypothetical protein HWN80_14980 [Candidatus Lokiarchaeota archaeon]|nr:hypothetical protein [Candidatus Lokiarchaeota archaeon]